MRVVLLFAWLALAAPAHADPIAGGAFAWRVAPVAASTLAPFLPEPGAAAPSEGAPDGRVAATSNGAVAAWYAAPTDRYRHGVLGDAIEAGALVVETAGRRLKHHLPDDEVFENRTPRLADLDGDGAPEIITIRASLSAGAAATVYGVENGRIVERGTTPFIGTANRWLNIAGIADFLGTGGRQIAYVETPHIGGTLRLVALEDRALRPVASLYGFSNHVIGARELRLSAAIDLDGDGLSELAVPSADRRALRIMTVRDGAWIEIGHAALPAAVVAPIGVVGAGLEARFVLGLRDGATVAVSRDGG